MRRKPIRSFLPGKNNLDLALIALIVFGVPLLLGIAHIRLDEFYNVSITEKVATIFSGFVSPFLSFYVLLLMSQQNREAQDNQLILEKELSVKEMIHSTESILNKFSFTGSIDLTDENNMNHPVMSFKGTGALGISELERFIYNYDFEQSKRTDFQLGSSLHFNDTAIITFLKSLNLCLVEVHQQISVDRRQYFFKIIDARLCCDMKEIASTFNRFKKLGEDYSHFDIKVFNIEDVLNLIDNIQKRNVELFQ